MKRRRRTPTPAEFAQREREEWPIFVEKMKAAPTVVEAWIVSQTGVGPDLPGRRFYSDLATFLGSNVIVARVSAAERQLYRELIERSVAAGVVKPEALKQFGPIRET